MLRVDDGNARNLVAVGSLRRLEHDDIVQADAAKSGEERVAMTGERHISGIPRHGGAGDVPNGVAQGALVVTLGDHGPEPDARNGDLAEGVAGLQWEL